MEKIGIAEAAKKEKERKMVWMIRPIIKMGDMDDHRKCKANVDITE